MDVHPVDPLRPDDLAAADVDQLAGQSPLSLEPHDGAVEHQAGARAPRDFGGHLFVNPDSVRVPQLLLQIKESLTAEHTQRRDLGQIGDHQFLQDLSESIGVLGIGQIVEAEDCECLRIDPCALLSTAWADVTPDHHGPGD
jgi:hypothetical protein